MQPLSQTPGTGRKTVVIVDDSIELTRTYQEVLELEGYRVILAASGPEAVDLLSRISPPDLLLVDYAMPGMSGVEFLRDLKKCEPKVFEMARIIGLSGHICESPLLEEMSTMVTQLVEKPNDISEIITLVNEATR